MSEPVWDEDADGALDPLARLGFLLERARNVEAHDATAMALATADLSGRPSVRMVLLKDVDARGLVFYTNLTSRKARELRANPEAAACLHWPTLAVQVRAEGPTEPVTDAEADAYFASRPRGSQIGAWASRQSQILGERAELLSRCRETEARFPAQVPRPAFWSGFRILPRTVEFWRADADRLHHRSLYRRGPDGWARELLFP